MKKIFYLIVILFCTSCKKFLDVKPTGILIPQTVEDFDKLLNNPSIANPSINNQWAIDPDTYMTDILYDALWDPQNQKQYTWDTATADINADDYDWNDRYAAIHIYNQIIPNIDGAELGRVPANMKGLIKGEAYAQRAFDYFILVNEYGPHYSAANLNKKAIPMPLKNNLLAQLPRSTLGEVYGQILSDLQVAEPLLETAPAYFSKANFRPGKAAVKALLALIYLYQGDFVKAVAYSNTALSLYNFVYDYNALQVKVPGNLWSGYNIPDFDQGVDTKEVLWHRIARYDLSDPVLLYAPGLINIFDKPNDNRWRLYASQKSYYGDNLAPDYCFATYGEREAGITVSNLMLVNAEAKARTNDAPGAVTALNILRAKRYKAAVANYVFTTNAALLTEIKNERRRELFATGLNLIDLKRYHAYGDPVPTFTRNVKGTTYTLEPGSYKYVVPICQKIRNLNPNLH